MISLTGKNGFLTPEDIAGVVQHTFETYDLKGARVLVIVPDGTRTMPLPLFFHLFYEALAPRVKTLDYLVALGTHQPMDDAALLRHMGITAEEKAGRYQKVRIFNHRWDLPETFAIFGNIPAGEVSALSQGMLAMDVPVRANRMLLDYDMIIICGPVFPHEVVGFSGGNKYLFPGVSGPEVINFTHWLGALISSSQVIGVQDTPVRAVINRAASLVPVPKLGFCPVVTSEGVVGLFAGDLAEAWPAAAQLSAKTHVRYVAKPYRQVLSLLPKMYDDLWTGAKGMYKLEPVIEDGGEVILYAPHITEVSYTHGRVIDEVGYHVRDYFVKQWDRFKSYPWGVLAHSTHVRGLGTFEGGVEHARIQVTLATGISPERCRRIGLGYCDPASIREADFGGREHEGILLVPHAGETLYRLK